MSKSTDIEPKRLMGADISPYHSIGPATENFQSGGSRILKRVGQVRAKRAPLRGFVAVLDKIEILW